ncbi:hypothetical protein D3C74_281660 [compost metagenome]
MELPGVGSGKAAEFGDEILEMTKHRERPGDFPLDWVEHEVDDDTFRTWLYRQKEIKYKLEMDKFTLRRCVLESLAEGRSLEGICDRAGIDRKQAIELMEQMEKEGYSFEALIQSELMEVPKEEQDEIWKAYEEMGDAFLKPVLQRVYDKEAAEGKNLDILYERLRLLRISYRRYGGNEATRKAV